VLFSEGLATESRWQQKQSLAVARLQAKGRLPYLSRRCRGAPVPADRYVASSASANPHRQPTLASAPNLRQRVGAGLRARQVQIVNASTSLRVGHPVASTNPHRQPTPTSAPNLRQRVGAGLRARQVKFTNAGKTFRFQITVVLRRNCAGRGMCDN
jgi:hypothetical protein